ncbi:hypothetical protein B9Z19DRAFT_1193069 [Tuber borchii]|uniref:ATP-grasp domain-containing protein n=1 Tax=Tuber borchii TaxID=42251 RepID=A0A2T6ZTG3_TUBBO|nr:hypothetical protein B9Z19DRAFT_1193069 [Tuber borchii]
MVHSSHQSLEDACAGIAYVVHSLNDPKTNITTPAPHANPAIDTCWSYLGTQPGILAAIAAGTNMIWAITPLLADHPLITTSLPSCIKLIANPPKVVDIVDDKAFTNKLLQHHGFLTPKSWLLEGDPKRAIERLGQLVYDLPCPVILKPVRGSGSEGVQLVNGFVSMLDALANLLNIDSVILVEELLEAEEGTVTLVPDGQGNFMALTIVLPFGHVSGVMPWSGHIPVAKNSRVLSAREEDSWRRAAKIECPKAAGLLKLTSATRIDICRKDENGGKFFLFDINSKPNLTGAGRPGRENQDSLCPLAAKEFGWEYPTFVRKFIETTRHLQEARAIESPGAVVGSFDNFTIWETWSGKGKDGVAGNSDVQEKSS